MLLKRFKITTEKDVDINENVYFLNNKNVKSCLVKYCTVNDIIIYTDKEDNTFNFN